MVNTCKEFQALPLTQGDPSVREFAPLSGGAIPDGEFITIFTSSALHPHNPRWRGKIKGIVPQFVFRSNVIFCVVMGCGMARSEGSLKLKIENSGLEVCQIMRFE